MCCFILWDNTFHCMILDILVYGNKIRCPRREKWPYICSKTHPSPLRSPSEFPSGSLFLTTGFSYSPFSPISLFSPLWEENASSPSTYPPSAISLPFQLLFGNHSEVNLLIQKCKSFIKVIYIMKLLKHIKEQREYNEPLYIHRPLSMIA